MGRQVEIFADLSRRYAARGRASLEWSQRRCVVSAQVIPFRAIWPGSARCKRWMSNPRRACCRQSGPETTIQASVQDFALTGPVVSQQHHQRETFMSSDAFDELRRRLKIRGDIMTMTAALTTDRLEQLAREIAREGRARLADVRRPRLVIDNTRERK